MSIIRIGCIKHVIQMIPFNCQNKICTYYVSRDVLVWPPHYFISYFRVSRINKFGFLLYTLFGVKFCALVCIVCLASRECLRVCSISISILCFRFLFSLLTTKKLSCFHFAVFKVLFRNSGNFFLPLFNVQILKTR